MPRRIAFAAAFALIAVACAGGVDNSAPGEESNPTMTDPPPTDPLPTNASDEASEPVLPFGPSALDTRDSTEFPEALVDPAEIISGGPPPDGIPPIDDPVFVTVAQADQYLSDAEPVVLLEIDGDARAYPVQVLIWHEIVNDTVGAVPVSITYCPLCNSAVSYIREVRGVETTFGTSGRLFASALVMYDRATESLWTHFDGRAVVGMLAGDSLEPIGSPLVAWEDFKEAFPGGQVLDRDSTGFSRDYGRNPYVGYDDQDGTPFLFRGALDDRARALQRVVGVTIGDDAKAWTIGAVSSGEASATHSQVAGQEIVILWVAGQASALEDSFVDEGRDVGSVGVFSPEVDGQSLTFEVQGAVFVDTQTASTWNVLGKATDGPLAGTSLERIPHLDTFWFAWSTYQAGSAIIEG
ncbi:MAG: DUF3179 domain-containing protein [Acidimicrobiia bacterium]|nr:DUF3179 domain-containing protein [Acidimicrobiia bacterium]